MIPPPLLRVAQSGTHEPGWIGASFSSNATAWRETLETLGRWSGRSRLRRWPRAGRRPKRPAPGSGRCLPSTARQSTPARLPRRGSCRSDRVAGWHRGRGAGHGNRRSREGERTQGASVRNMRGLLQSAAGANVLGPAAFASGSRVGGREGRYACGPVVESGEPASFASPVLGSRASWVRERKPSFRYTRVRFASTVRSVT